MIQNYRKVFQDEVSAMKDGRQLENELYIRNYQQGISVLTAYFSVMLLIEKNLETIQIEGLLKDILTSEADTLTIKNRYYFLESRLNTIMGELAQKMTSLNSEKNTLLTQTQL